MTSFKDASEHAKATYVLFDAYRYMDEAEAEIEPRKKAQYYQMAEKLLEASLARMWRQDTGRL